MIETSGRALAFLLTALVLCMAGSNLVIADSENADLERQANAVLAKVLAAWKHTDAHAIAAQYEPDGDFVSPTGEHAASASAIEAFYSSAFERGYAGTSTTATLSHARRLPGGYAVIDGFWGIKPTPKSKITESESGLFFALLHMRNGQWRIVALREQSSAQVLHELE